MDENVCEFCGGAGYTVEIFILHDDGVHQLATVHIDCANSKRTQQIRASARWN